MLDVQDSVWHFPRMTTQKSSRRNAFDSCSVVTSGRRGGKPFCPWPSAVHLAPEMLLPTPLSEAADRMSQQTTHRSHHNSNGMRLPWTDTRHTAEAEHPQSKDPNVPDLFESSMMLMPHTKNLRPDLKSVQTTDAVQDYLQVYVKQRFMFRLGTHTHQVISLYLSKYSKI